MHKNFTPVKKRYATLLFVCVLGLIKLNAQAPTIVFQPVLNGLSNPVDIVNAADGTNRIFIVQQAGTIKVYDQTLNSLGDFLTVTGVTFTGTGDERGLLSLVFHPNYETNRYFYVWYAVTASNVTSVHLDRFQTRADSPNRADPSTRLGILSIDKPAGSGFTNHNGAKLNFGTDGYLYVATGDGGSGNDPFNNAQNGNSLLGKMLRIDINNPDPPFYSIPPDNPYVSDPNVRDEIWDLGLRNPWRWSFDKLTQDMWIADVGQGDREEVNFRSAGNTAGINYGWRCMEGTIHNPCSCVPTCTPAGHVLPIFDYSHNPATGGFTVIGGYVYRGTEFPNLYGYYITGDYLSQNVWLLHSDGSNVMQHVGPNSLYSFGEAEDGTIYAAAGSSILKVVALAQAPTPVKLISFTLRQSDNFNDLYWKTATESNVQEFAVESSNDGINFTIAGKVASSQQSNGSSYSFRHFTSNNRKLFYRLNTIDNDGTSEFSRTISTASLRETDPIKLYPPTGSSMLVELNTTFYSMKIVNMYGQVVHHQLTGNASGIFYINTSNWKKGVYVLIASNNEQQLSRKFMIQ